MDYFDPTRFNSVNADDIYRHDTKKNPYIPEFKVTVSQEDINKLLEKSKSSNIDKFEEDRLKLLQYRENIEENKDETSINKLTLDKIVKQFSDTIIELLKEGHFFFREENRYKYVYLGIIIIGFVLLLKIL